VLTVLVNPLVLQSRTGSLLTRPSR